jgi:hypothetical protein
MAGRALVLTPDQTAEVNQDILRSAHDAFEARDSGLRNFPVFLRECLEKRVWEQERRFPGGTKQGPISFEDFVRKPFPVGLGTTLAAVERVVAENEKLAAEWIAITGREAVAPAPSTLPELERVIGDGLRTFVEVGRALAKIRDDGLYKGDHRTFEAYCKDRWQFSRRRAYELIDASSVVENVRHGAQISGVPTNERQTRPLSQLSAEQQAPAWEEAVRTAPDGKVTAKHVAEVVAARSAPAVDAPEDQTVTEPSRTQNVVKLGPVDRAMGLVRNMSEPDVYEFKKRFLAYLEERVTGEIEQ